MRRIHLAAVGGGAACGAHSLGKPNGERDVIASLELPLVDCRKCKYTDRYKQLLNPAQYRLRLFTAINGDKQEAAAVAQPRKNVA